MQTTTQTPTITGPEETSDQDERTGTTDDNEIYLDSALTLIAGGEEQRDPSDPLDLHFTSVDEGEQLTARESGPAWKAEDLYKSVHFDAKRDFAKNVSRWTDSTSAAGWAILSPENYVIEPWADVAPYDTTFDDLGDDPTNPDHRMTFPYRRPDGGEVVTEMDKWATMVAISLDKWVASHREKGVAGANDASSLLIVADPEIIEPLRKRDVFKYGGSRCTGNPNKTREFPLNVRFVFEEAGVETRSEQIAWLSDQIESMGGEPEESENHQKELGRWTGDTRKCVVCGTSPDEEPLVDRNGDAYCSRCEPEPCARCGDWTTESGLGAYPLCPNCQTDSGGQKRGPVTEETTEQAGLSEVLTDGGR